MRGGFSKFVCFVLFFQVPQVRLVLVKPNSCLDCELPHNHLFIIIYLFIESSRSKARLRDKWRSREERGQNSTKREKSRKLQGGRGKGGKANVTSVRGYGYFLELYITTLWSPGANTQCPSGWMLNGPACYKMITQR